MQRTRNGILNGHEIFHRQMADMKEILLSIRNRNAERSLTHAQWLYLLQRVLRIVQSGKSVSLHTLLSEIVTQDGDETISIARRCFVSAYSDRSIHSPEWFDHCCQFAIHVMAHCLAAKAYHQRELMSERVIREQCEQALKELASKLDEFQPCEALYTGKGRSSKNNVDNHAVFCYQHKGAHVDGRRTCQSVYKPTFLDKFFGWGSMDVWLGEFLSSSSNGNELGCLTNISVDDLSSSVRELMNTFRQEPKAIYSVFIHLITRWGFEEHSSISSCVCFCPPHKISSPINSDFAPYRSPTISAMRVGTKRLRLFLNTSSKFGRSRCSICKQQISGAWSQLFSSTPSPTTSPFSLLSSETPDCAICFESKRDFLFIPCGHRGFCEICADELLRTSSLCPFCRSSVTGKQRVHDV